MNVGEALERVLSRKHTVLKEAAAGVDRLGAEPNQVAPTPSPPLSVPPTSQRPSRKEQLRQARRARRLGRYEEVAALYEQGFSQRAIGRQLGIATRTVQRFLKAGSFPERAQRARRPTMLTPHESYLRERWTAGCHNSTPSGRRSASAASPAQPPSSVSPWHAGGRLLVAAAQRHGASPLGPHLRLRQLPSRRECSHHVRLAGLC